MIGISIIIPISGRVNLLRQMLEKFQSIHKISMAFEILVVDNSLSEIDSHAIAGLCKENSVRYLKTTPGVVKARNTGAENAAYEYLLFIDSDCTPDDSLLLEYSKLITKKSPAAVTGTTIFSGRESVWWRMLKDSYFLIPFKWSQFDSNLLWAPLSNLMISKDTYIKIGGIHSILPPKEASEDVDIGVRLNNAGLLLISCPQAIVYHTTETWNSLSVIVERFFRFGMGEAQMLDKHPNRHEKEIPPFVFLIFAIGLIQLIMIVLGTKISVSDLIKLLSTLVITSVFFRCFLPFKGMNSALQLFFLSIIEQVYNLGKLYQLLRLLKFNLLFRSFAFSKFSYIGSWDKNIRRFYAYFLTLILLILLL